jgi:hypothetical protein
MKTPVFLIIAASLALSGCIDGINHPDMTPPRPPTGLSTATGDNFIELFWKRNPENDVAGYNVFVSSSYDGRYELIGSSETSYFLDKDAVNGNIYYYAVTAYDYEGNESDLSKDVAYDIPRPEGYDVQLSDYHLSPATGGYDFSSYAVVRYDNDNADMYMENYNGVMCMNVRTDTDIQDMGSTASILDISTAPTTGWSTTHDAVLKVGHTYVVWTWDDHFAKFRVHALSSSRMVFDWAYQTKPSTTLLKRGGSGMDRSPLSPTMTH